LVILRFEISGVYGSYTITKEVVGVFVRFSCAASITMSNICAVVLVVVRWKYWIVTRKFAKEQERGVGLLEPWIPDCTIIG
jgi:hypothetical protein